MCVDSARDFRLFTFITGWKYSEYLVIQQPEIDLARLCNLLDKEVMAMFRNIAKLSVTRSLIGVNSRNISTTSKLNDIFKVQVCLSHFRLPHHPSYYISLNVFLQHQGRERF